MARRRIVAKREVKPDALYKDKLLAKFINRSMRGGKRSVAARQVYGALELAKEKLGKSGLEVFKGAVENVKPTMEVRARRVGGAAYQVPVPVRGARREALAIRWLIGEARKRSNSEYHTYADKLAAELVAAYGNEGGAVRKKEEIHRMAEANKAFAHFRW